MSIDFTPARVGGHNKRPMNFDLSIQRTDRKARSGRPTSLYFTVSPAALIKWGVTDEDQVTGHYDEGMWEVRIIKPGQIGYTLRISSKENNIRNCPEGWGRFRLSCTKAKADSVGIDRMKFFELVDARDGSAWFMEKDGGISFVPDSRAAAARKAWVTRRNGKAG